MIQVDSNGVAERISDEDVRWERPTSGRRVRANRRNGPRAKGRKTEAGKQRSAQNAVRHGALATALRPIERGPFAEDEEAFWDKVDLIVDSLDPRDALEEGVARQIAGQLIRVDRLGLLETAGHESAARLTNAQREHLSREDSLDELAACARGLHFFLIGAIGVEEVPYRDFATLMRTLGPRPGFSIKGLWDESHEPKSRGDWEKACDILVQMLWPNKEAAADWAYQTSQRFAEEWEAVNGRGRELVADQVLDDIFDKVTRYSGRITTDLARSLDLYRTLQSRTLPADGSNEPNADE